MGFLVPNKKTDIPVEIKVDEDIWGDEALCLFYGTVKVAYFTEGSMVTFGLDSDDVVYLKAHDIETKKTRFGTKIVVS